MIDPKINKAIYEALGNPIGCPWCSDLECTYNRGPDYCNDLNAMHEAENCLSLDDRNHYIDALGTIYKDSWEFATATARQRAEAFLRTIGKWDQSGKRTEMEVRE